MKKANKPWIIEFTGLPISGKTTLAQLLSNYLSSKKVSNLVINEKAERATQTILREHKTSWIFNAWTCCNTISSIIEATNYPNIEIIVVDRGLYDAICMFEWHFINNRITSKLKKKIYDFITVSDWFDRTSIVISLNVSFEQALERRAGITGRIVNEVTFKELSTAQDNVRKIRSNFFKSEFIEIETDNKSPLNILNQIVKVLEKN